DIFDLIFQDRDFLPEIAQSLYRNSAVLVAAILRFLVCRLYINEIRNL
ncbi:MAG: hypothetical protein PWR01_3929, partial [Clostridiales bacterium]|nr:hypothetical protein [Clostridiales bacterium]MDN5282856.1 hypothetical protein [Candidatus Ozemobacter sp.]